MSKLKALEATANFFKAATNLINRGVSKEGIINFAKQEFGEVSDLILARINQLFRKKESGTLDPFKRQPIGQDGNIIEASFKPGRDKTGKVVEESESQASGIMSRLEQKQKDLFSMKNPRRPGGPLDPVEGMTRTAARVVLGNKKINIPEKTDPIDIFEENFGGDALMDLRQVGEELLEKEKTGRITESMGEFLESRGMFDLKVDKTARKGMTDEEFRKFLMDNGVDPDDTGFADGGRVKYAFGSGVKLAKFLAIRGKTLKDEIKKAIDNFIQPSGDTKFDADVVLDDMLEELGTSRGEIDQKDIIDAYGQIYDKMIKPVAATLKNKPAPFTGEGLDLAPKMVERFKLKQKYPGIDDELLDQIIEMDPDKKAQMFADMEMGTKLIEEGRGLDEVKDIIEKGAKTRKDNAEGGLNYLMGM